MPSACGTLDTPATSKAFQSSGKIDGNSVPDHLTSDQNEPPKEIPQADHIRGRTPPLTGLKKSRVWLTPPHCFAMLARLPPGGIRSPITDDGRRLSRLLAGDANARASSHETRPLA